MAETTAPSPTSASEIIERLREERLRRKAAREPMGTLAEVSEVIGVSIGMLGFWELGKDWPTEPRMRAWLRALHLPAQWAVIYDEDRKAGDVDRILASMKLTPSQQQARERLLKALRERRER